MSGFDGQGTEPNELPVGSGPEQQGMNPAWNDLLNQVPQELHEKIAPTLKQWDQNFQNQVQKVQSEYEPWKDITKNYDPETASFGLNLLSALETNPREVYDRIGQFYKFAEEQQAASTSTDQGQETDTGEDPYGYGSKLKQLEEHNELIARTLLEKQQAEQQAQEDAALEQELTSLQEKYKQNGPFDQFFVLARAQANGGDIEKGVQEFYQWRDQQMQSYVPKPLIMGTGGGLPLQNTDVTKMGNKDVKNLMVEILETAKRASND